MTVASNAELKCTKFN